MRTLLITLVLALAVVGVLFALGIFEGDPTAPQPDISRTGPGTEEESALLTGTGPTDEPEVEELPLIDPLNILVLAGVPQRLNLYLARSWERHPKMTVQSWAPAVNVPNVPSPGILPGGLVEPPTDAVFSDEKIDVLVVHDFDPTLLDDAFWQAVDERVRSGRLGLYVQPGVQSGAAMLAHPVLGELLPVEEATPLEGSPIPGAFGHLVPFQLTEEGARHPATRLVQWPRWSETMWETRTAGDFPWGTAFAYPVKALRDGSVVLLRNQPPRQPDTAPTFVVGATETGRVIWNGAWELGSRKAYGRAQIVDDWEKLVRNWVIFLGGRVL